MTDARSCPVSNRTRPSSCSMTYAFTGRGGVQRREPRIHAYMGIRLPSGCWGWIWVVPVLTTETDLMDPLVVGPDRPLVGLASVMLAVMSSPVAEGPAWTLAQKPWRTTAGAVSNLGAAAG